MKTFTKMSCVFLAGVVCCAFATSAQAQDRDREETPRFQPQNDRERMLLKMIDSLRAEVADLRRQVRGSGGARDGDRVREGIQLHDGDRPSRERMGDGDRPVREGLRDGDRASRERDVRRDSDRAPANNRILQQSRRIFATYDKDKNGTVSFEEWLAMREGEMTSERRAQQRNFYNASGGTDDKITPEEFYRAMLARQQGKAGREGNRDQGREERPSRDRDPR